jgi:hypothetical protein
MKLVLADVQADALERATDELLGQGAEVLAMVCDVSKGAHVQELADAAMPASTASTWCSTMPASARAA